MGRVSLFAGMFSVAGPLLFISTRASYYNLCGASLLLALLALPAAIVAIVLGYAARRQTGGAEGTGGLACGCVGLFLLFLAASSMSMPPCGERHVRNWEYAVGSLRTINTALVSYSNAYPRVGFPSKLRELGPPPAGQPVGPAAADMIDGFLARGDGTGYRFEYVPGPTDSQGRIISYHISARPIRWGETGKRSLYTDQSGVIRYTDENRAVTSADPVL